MVILTYKSKTNTNFNKTAISGKITDEYTLVMINLILIVFLNSLNIFKYNKVMFCLTVIVLMFYVVHGRPTSNEELIEVITNISKRNNDDRTKSNLPIITNGNGIEKRIITKSVHGAYEQFLLPSEYLIDKLKTSPPPPPPEY